MSLKTPLQVLLDLVTFFCVSPKYAAALGLGLGLMSNLFFGRILLFILFLGLVVNTIACAVTYLQHIKRIPKGCWGGFMCGMFGGLLLSAFILFVQARVSFSEIFS